MAQTSLRSENLNVVGTEPWLVVVDMQKIFGNPDSDWYTPRFGEIVAPIHQLIQHANAQVCFTRFIAPAQPKGSWIDYYKDWPFALQSPDCADYQLVNTFISSPGLRVDVTTFSKWNAILEHTVPIGGRMILCGVSTDCCVLSTALAAADAGVHVQVVEDACAGVSDAAHYRALDVLRLYRPLVEVVRVSDVLKNGAEVTK